MKKQIQRKSIFLILISLVLLFTSCASNDISNIASNTEVGSTIKEERKKGTGKIYLYGEVHGVPMIHEKELELWKNYYNNHGMRHLFIETSYYKAQFLNMWMQAEDDTLLDLLCKELEESGASWIQEKKVFYQKIKEECPETIFHGTDVGHQYDTTGKRYLANLRAMGMIHSKEYELAQLAIEQGKTFYDSEGDALMSNAVYRENMMTENFIREYESLENEDIMGIYGGAHTEIDALDYTTNQVPCMANQLYQKYGEKIYTEALWKWYELEMNTQVVE
ncbi:MAG: hypothetical protein IKJ01_00355 [Lachnospiraceae bacterium]|nr:hypothetical protein [Lachnospiraceae bacterium]